MCIKSTVLAGVARKAGTEPQWRPASGTVYSLHFPVIRLVSCPNLTQLPVQPVGPRYQAAEDRSSPVAVGLFMLFFSANDKTCIAQYIPWGKPERRWFKCNKEINKQFILTEFTIFGVRQAYISDHTSETIFLNKISPLVKLKCSVDCKHFPHSVISTIGFLIFITLLIRQ